MMTHLRAGRRQMAPAAGGGVGCGGIPTADVIATEDGERLVDADGRIWVMFRHLAGTEYDYANARQPRSAARCLADLRRHVGRMRRLSVR
jgi:hypothetical protein